MRQLISGKLIIHRVQHSMGRGTGMIPDYLFAVVAIGNPSFLDSHDVIIVVVRYTDSSPWRWGVRWQDIYRMSADVVVHHLSDNTFDGDLDAFFRISVLA